MVLISGFTTGPGYNKRKLNYEELLADRSNMHLSKALYDKVAAFNTDNVNNPKLTAEEMASFNSELSKVNISNTTFELRLYKSNTTDEKYIISETHNFNAQMTYNDETASYEYNNGYRSLSFASPKITTEMDSATIETLEKALCDAFKATSSATINKKVYITLESKLLTSIETPAMTKTVAALNISTQQGANDAISTIDHAISIVSGMRAQLSAYENGLERTINNLGSTSENLATAESRIRDTDMAKEMMDYTKSNLLMQVSQTMMAQANQFPAQILKMLA